MRKTTTKKPPAQCKTCYGKGWYLLAPYKDQRNGVKTPCETCGGSGTV
jgi:DnaJ-class molecular chaperone